MEYDKVDFQDFLELSVDLTAFSEVELQGTGCAALYLETTLKVVGEETLADLLRIYRALVGEAEDSQGRRDDLLRARLLASPKLGPVVRNIIKLWYVSTWYELPQAWRDEYGTRAEAGTFIAAPWAYPEGLLWPAVGSHPPGAKAPGYGTWSRPPRIPVTPGRECCDEPTVPKQGDQPVSGHSHSHDVTTTGSKDSNNPNILAYLNDGSTKQPFFEKATLATEQDDGYWIEAVDVTGNGKLDLVTSGLAVGNVVWYENPNWKKRTIARFPLPVTVIPGDINGNGRNDLFVSHNYGNCMFWCRPEDGKISWLENPGETSGGAEWKKHHIADLMATHRLQFGHFSRTDKKELLALPVVGCKPFGVGVHEPVAMTLFPVPDDLSDGGDWKGNVINKDTFRIIHGVVNHPFKGGSDAALNSFLLASEEGISWFYFDSDAGTWKRAPIGPGDSTNADKGFKGSGNVAFGKLGDDPYGYICTIDPFHGNIVTVYTRKPDDRLPGADLTARPWNRHVLDTFGEFSETSQGAGHHVVTGDFDGDGDDEFLVALRGPLPTQGVYYYKAIDAPNGYFERWRVSTASAARIAIGDFDGDGRSDFATTGYYTPGYFLCDNSQVNIFYNRFGAVPDS